MLCPSCNKKITSLKVVYVVITDARLDDNGEMRTNTEECKNELDEYVDFDKKLPSYYCWNCNHFFTHNTDLAKTILNEKD